MTSRPSQLLSLDDPYVAYCLDEAVAYFGSGVEARLEQIKSKNAKSQAAQRTAFLQRFLTGREKAAAFASATPTK